MTEAWAKKIRIGDDLVEQGGNESLAQGVAELREVLELVRAMGVPEAN